MPDSDSSFLTKYSPRTFDQFIRPAPHALIKAQVFLQKPKPSHWLLYGKMGLGKSAMARLMATAATGDEAYVHQYQGRNLSESLLETLSEKKSTRNTGNKLQAVVVDEADGISKASREVLFGVLDRPTNVCWFLTTNSKLKDFEPGLATRLKKIHFSSHGIAGPAAAWLVDVATKEGFELSGSEAAKIVKEAKNNLREALSLLEDMCDGAIGKKLEYFPTEFDQEAA